MTTLATQRSRFPKSWLFPLEVPHPSPLSCSKLLTLIISVARLESQLALKDHKLYLCCIASTSCCSPSYILNCKRASQCEDSAAVLTHLMLSLWPESVSLQAWWVCGPFLEWHCGRVHHCVGCIINLEWGILIISSALDICKVYWVLEEVSFFLFLIFSQLLDLSHLVFPFPSLPPLSQSFPFALLPSSLPSPLFCSQDR